LPAAFSRLSLAADTNNNIIINEKAAIEFGFGSAQNAVNKKVQNNFQGNTTAFTIIGVVKDFHYEDLHLPVTPYGFLLNTGGYNYMVIHTKQGNMATLLKTIEASWKKYDPNDPFDYTFLDEDFQKNYQADTRLAGIVGYFTVVAILISCLGLFGLAAFSAEQRTKEIGVRKVLGASVKPSYRYYQ
jgi:putative ABC transport system permease protein